MRFTVLTIIVLEHTLNFGQFRIDEFSSAQKTFEQEELSAVLQDAAHRFNNQLNVYRKAQGAKELQTHNPIWLVALNHCMWMRENKMLEHDEKRGTKYFTGKYPSERLKYVDAKLKYSALGENIAHIDLLEDDIKATENLAEQLSKEFFGIWKKSKGHRQNMISKTFTHHAICILKTGTRFYAVSIFYSK